MKILHTDKCPNKESSQHCNTTEMDCSHERDRGLPSWHTYSQVNVFFFSVQLLRLMEGGGFDSPQIQTQLLPALPNVLPLLLLLQFWWIDNSLSLETKTRTTAISKNKINNH